MLARLRPSFLAIASAAAAFHGGALAVNGALPGGTGIKNAAMGGASIALPLDAVAAANNPAGLAFVPSSVTLGLQVFSGQSSADYVLPGNHLENRQTEPVPEAGFNWNLDSRWTVGLSVSGAGAGSDYGQPALPVAGAGTAKTTLRVAELVPAVAWKPHADLAFGLGLTLARQQFEADGVIVPTPSGPMPIAGHGQQSATGVGLRAGLLWKPAADWTLGASIKSRVHMGKLSGYDRDLLAYSRGRLDVPGQYGIGVAWQPTERLTLAADWLRILWGDTKAMQDPNGFAWRNQPVWRIGAAWALDERWTLRAGYSANRGQIDSSRAVQNLLVPSIHEKAYTAGVSWRFGPSSELNLGYELNPRTTLAGTGPSTGTTLTSKVRMLLLGYHHTF